MRFTESTRVKIKMRAGMRCDLCGGRTTGGQIHHRQPRGMGGSANDEAKGTPANGLYVHPHCHENIEMDRTRSLKYGWLVRQSDEAEHMPVLLYDGWWLLAADGTMAKVDRPVEVDAAAMP